jgi:2-polyprenyl-3-methyl-5-hydroxy-6-metoxy-1,4-benzoquinol methylase
LNPAQSTLALAADERVQLLDVLRCPVCHADFDEDYKCAGGHTFEVVDGVPLLIPSLEGAAGSISASFGREWNYFRHGLDRTWAQTVETRKADFLRMVDMTADEVASKRVLDAGCGNGMLSEAIAEFGCDVVAGDVSESPQHAARYFGERGGRVQFLRANLMEHPFKPESFDIVFCAGVLHHTPSTRGTFDKVAEAVAPGGRYFVWLYHKRPGVKYKVKTGIRSVVAPLPEPVKHAVAVAEAAEKSVRLKLIRRDGLAWNERLIATHDFYTPRYRFEHTPDEVHGWFAEHGYVESKVTEVGPDGFGVVGVKPS